MEIAHGKSNWKLEPYVQISYPNKDKISYNHICNLQFKNCHNYLQNDIIRLYNQVIACKKKKYTVSIANYFQIFGLTESIKSYINIIDKTKYYICRLNMNPVLERIIILKYKNLLIPKHILWKCLNPLVGLPKNYKSFYRTIEKIYLWYKDRGLEYININLIDYYKSNQIYIKIIERQINSIQLICKSQISLVNIAYLENRMHKDLSKFIGQRLNINEINQEIQKFKDFKFIKTCKYKIIDHDNKIKIIIHYELYKNSISYVNEKNVYLNNTKYAYYIADKRNQLNKITRIIDLFSTLNQKINDIKNKLYRYSKTIEQNLLFNFSMWNQNYFYKNLILDYKFIKRHLYYDIFLLLPNSQQHNNLIVYLLIHIYNCLHKILIHYPSIITQINIKKCSIAYFCSRVYGINIKFQQTTESHLDINCKINYLLSFRNKRSLYLINQFNNIRWLNITDNIDHISRIINKTVQEKSIELHFSIKNRRSNASFIASLTSLIYLPFKKLNLRYSAYHLHQTLIIKWKKIFILNKNISSVTIHKNSLNIYIQLYFPYIYKDYKYINFKNLLKYNNVDSKNYSYNLIYTNIYPLFLYKIEYYYVINNYFSFYVFNNYIRQLFINNISRTYLYTDRVIHLPKNTINIGSGIQLKIPIKNIPPLSIEYILNNKSNNFFQWEVYYRYKEHDRFNVCHSNN